VTQGAAGIGTFPCPKIDRDGFTYKDVLSSAVGHENRCPPSEDKELSICEDTVHSSYSGCPLLFRKSCRKYDRGER
jgi:hypothetical protein